MSTKPYIDHLYERLRTPEKAIAYIEAAIEQDDPAVLELALQDVGKANAEFPKIEEWLRSWTDDHVARFHPSFGVRLLEQLWSKESDAESI